MHEGKEVKEEGRMGKVTAIAMEFLVHQGEKGSAKHVYRSQDKTGESDNAERIQVKRELLLVCGGVGRNCNGHINGADS